MRLVLHHLLQIDFFAWAVGCLLPELACFASALYLLYPRAGVGSLAVAPDFNHLANTIETALSMGTRSQPAASLDLWNVVLPEMGPSEALSLGAWACYYYGGAMLISGGAEPAA